MERKYDYDLNEVIEIKEDRLTGPQYNRKLTLGEVIESAKEMQLCDDLDWYFSHRRKTDYSLYYYDINKSMDCYLWLQRNRPNIFKSEILNLGGGIDDEIFKLDCKKYFTGMDMSQKLKIYDIISYANEAADGKYEYIKKKYITWPDKVYTSEACYNWLKDNKPELFDKESGRFILPSELAAKQQPDVLPEINDKFNELKTISHSLMNGTCKDTFQSIKRAKLLMDSIDSLCSKLIELDRGANDKCKEKIKETMNKVTKIRRFIGNYRKVAEIKRKVFKLEEEFNKTNPKDILIENMEQLRQLCKEAVSLKETFDNELSKNNCA